MADYSKSVDWIDSTALDLLFFRQFFFPGGQGRKKPGTDLERLRNAVKLITKDMSEFVRRLRFHVYVRKKGPGIKDLVAEVLDNMDE